MNLFSLLKRISPTSIAMKWNSWVDAKLSTDQTDFNLTHDVTQDYIPKFLNA